MLGWRKWDDNNIFPATLTSELKKEINPNKRKVNGIKKKITQLLLTLVGINIPNFFSNDQNAYHKYLFKVLKCIGTPFAHFDYQCHPRDQYT